MRTSLDLTRWIGPLAGSVMGTELRFSQCRLHFYLLKYADLRFINILSERDPCRCSIMELVLKNTALQKIVHTVYKQRGNARLERSARPSWCHFNGKCGQLPQPMCIKDLMLIKTPFNDNALCIITWKGCKDLIRFKLKESRRPVQCVRKMCYL